MRLFGSSGIRNLANMELIGQAVKVGLAVGEPGQAIVVGSDTRTSSSSMKHALISGILAAGSDCYDCAVVPTPTLALAAKHCKAGIMITASHNPPQYNGMKLLNPDGSAFNSEQRKEIEELVLGSSLSAVPWQQFKTSFSQQLAVNRHIERIIRDFPNHKKIKVVLDCACGAASVITPYLLRELGCEVISLNSNPSGFFPHDVEPTEANLADLMATTKGLSADLGIAHDGDADRMMVIDDQGRFVTGDSLMVIFAQELNVKEIVTTVDASRILGDMGFEVTVTKVGDTYVSEKLGDIGEFGGEPSGCWIFPQVSLCPDGIYAAALISSIASKHSISSLLDKLPTYPIIRGSITIDNTSISELEQRLAKLRPASINTLDGIRLDFDDGWLLIRPSGTEPKIRITAEARDKKKARELYDHAIQAIQEGAAK